MKLKQVQFVHTVSFGGQLQSASANAVGDRPGQGGMDIELGLFDGVRCIALSRLMNGRMATRLVPMGNVACFEPLEVPAPAAKK